MKKKDKEEKGDLITHLLDVVKKKNTRVANIVTCFFNFGRGKDLKDDVVTSLLMCLTVGMKASWVMQLQNCIFCSLLITLLR